MKEERKRGRGMEERGEKRHKYQEASLEVGNGEGEGGCNFINGLTSHLMEGLPSLYSHGRPFSSWWWSWEPSNIKQFLKAKTCRAPLLFHI